ncbi:hypothetical protein Tco_1130389, partial [Tanacetum coccineum]
RKEHEGHLKLILKLLKEEKFEGIHVDPAKIEAIKDWASPKIPTEIRQFVGGDGRAAMEVGCGVVAVVDGNRGGGVIVGDEGGFVEMELKVVAVLTRSVAGGGVVVFGEDEGGLGVVVEADGCWSEKGRRRKLAGKRERRWRVARFL